jgi:Carboxypeptidase regulatory-like domain
MQSTKRVCELRNELRRKSAVIGACWLGLLLLVLCPRLAAEESQAAASEHSISGSVLDPSASLVEGAQVELVDSDGKQIALTSTDRMGTFHFDHVPRGKYRVAVRASGFKEARVEVTMGAKSVQLLRIALSIAAISETVDVNAEETGIAVNPEATENQNANNIDRNALDRVPVFDQDYVTMLSRFLDDNAIGTNGISLVVNGVEANGPGVSPSAVEEVKINQNPYSARFARPGRARLEITTKPGTPQFHGTANFLVRDSVFDARNAFAATKPAESRYLSEGSLTGPLGKNKANTFLLSLEQDDDNPQAIVYAIGPGNNLIQANVPAPVRHSFVALRAFHDFAAGDQVWVAYSYENQTKKNQGVGGTVLPEAGYSTDSMEQEVNVSYRHIFSPKWANQLRFLVGHNAQPVFSNVAAPQVIVEGYFTGGGAQADSKRTETHVDGTDFATYSGGKHVLTFGVDIPDLSRRGAEDYTYQQGAYTFGDLAAYEAGQPSGYKVQTGNGKVIFWERTVAGFIEDSIRAKPNLSVYVGLRYYFQNYFNDDPDNFAPRFGFAYAPTKNSKTVFRGGAGIFYDRSGPRPIADLLHFNGVNLLRYFLPMQTGGSVPYPVVPADLQGVPTSLVVLDPRLRIPYIFQYSFGIERQVTAKSTFSATYIGSRGIDLFRSRDTNAPPPPDYAARPDLNLGQVRQMESEGYQKQNALELTFRGKPSKLFSGQAQYTLGKTYNNTSGITYFPGNSNFASLDWARSDNDRRHKLDLLGSFEASDLVTFGVAFQAYSGKPVNVITGLDGNGDGIFNDRSLGGLAPRNSLHGPSLINLDVNVAHDFRFHKEKKGGPTLTVALNVFNVLNHVNDLTYIGVVGPNLGTASAAYPARRFQLNLEFKF